MSLFCWTQRKIFWRMWETEQFWGTIDFHSIFFPTIEVNGALKQPDYKLSSKYLTLCLAVQRNSYRFGTTWGWVKAIAYWIRNFRMRFSVFSYSSSFPIKMHAMDAKTQKIEPDPNFFWRTKVSEAVCKCDWHNVRSYLFFNVRKFRTKISYSVCRDLKWWHNFHFWVNYPFKIAEIYKYIIYYRLSGPPIM